MTFESNVSYHVGVRWVAILWISLGLGIAHAAPQVEVKAHTRLALSKVKLRDGGMIEVSGQLIDKLTGDGIGHERIEVWIGTERTYVVSAVDGSFKATLPGSDGAQEVKLIYGGGRALDRADPLTVTTDPTKSQVELAIAKIADDPAGVRLRVAAVGDDGPLAVSVNLAIAGTSPADGFKPLRAVETGKELLLTRREAGGPGLHRLRAIFGGDDARQGQTAEITLELTSATTTLMHLSATRLAFEDDLVVTGKVIDDDDHPVARAAVTLVSGDKRLAQGATAEDGSYRFKVEAQVLGTTTVGAAGPRGGSPPNAPNATSATDQLARDAGEIQYGIQVQADPGASYIRPSRSQPEIIRVAAPQPVPVSYTVAAFLATALAAGGFFLARTKPWQRLRRPTPPAEVPSEEGEIDVAHGGLVVAKPSLVSTLRRANDDGVSGVIRDTVRGRPIADALVRVVLGDTAHEVRSGADGSFALEHLGVGDWRAEVAAPGHVTETFGVTIPHRGELRGVRVDLVPVRERVFQLYRRAAEPILPEPRLWGIWSPRQIVDHVRNRRPTPALADLTDFVEEIYFSPRPAAETVLVQASEQVDRAIHERARAPAR